MKNFFCRKCDYFGVAESHQIPGKEVVCQARAQGTGNRHAALGKLALNSEGEKENLLRTRESVICLCHKNKVAKRKLVRMGVPV